MYPLCGNSDLGCSHRCWIAVHHRPDPKNEAQWVTESKREPTDKGRGGSRWHTVSCDAALYTPRTSGGTIGTSLFLRVRTSLLRCTGTMEVARPTTDYWWCCRHMLWLSLLLLLLYCLGCFLSLLNERTTTKPNDKWNNQPNLDSKGNQRRGKLILI
jgi:hypothetical protein